MKEWIISICIIIVLSTIICILLPNGKTSNVIKSIISIMVLSVFLRPITFVINSDLEFDFFNNDQAVDLQIEYLDYVAKSKIESYKNACSKILEENGIFDGEISFEYSFNQANVMEITKVYLNLSEAVIISDKEHIDIINEIKNEISKIFLSNLNNMEFIIYE